MEMYSQAMAIAAQKEQSSESSEVQFWTFTPTQV